jgi:hypothetical protein
MLHHKSSFGVLSGDYFKKAINVILKDNQIKLELFSDDYLKAKSMLSLHQDIFNESQFKHKSQDPIEVFYRIANADSIITSNSTFSIWAAFVSPTASLVIVPSEFRYDGLSNIGALPSSWQSIESIWIS